MKVATNFWLLPGLRHGFGFEGSSSYENS